jgi:alkylated DNA repair protein (DNA oxidative demethylase)
LAEGAVVLAGFASNADEQLLSEIQAVAEVAPFRRMLTPGGRAMSVAMTNCGDAGWVTDRRGYRYESVDPETGRAWAAMPNAFAELARTAAEAAGFTNFLPDACLINRYEPGARMALHQDRDERDFAQPIVSVSLGLPAIFRWGGQQRSDRAQKVSLLHGDVVVWGGPARLTFHGVDELADGAHALVGSVRFNLTLRRAR